ncbi:galactose oxidase [Pedobacter sp. Du54]|uniref:Kelch repeat-containing protein n=1 Tax=Pedobacter anseongensis TaxID=3133439 RepID=UPI0030B584A1
MQYLKILLLIMLTSITSLTNAQTSTQNKLFKWSELPSLPDKFGFAGSFGGVSGDALIVGGGANFPDGGAPWTGSKKVWSDKIFVFDKAVGAWKLAGTLPEPLGYGVSITYNGKLICIGGSNELGHVAKVFAIEYKNGKIEMEEMKSLPHSLANASGTLIKDKIYIAGGLAKADSQETSNCFWTLDLKGGNQAEWKALNTWPGPPRMLAVAGNNAESFYLFSGTNLIKNKDGALERIYLKDAFMYDPDKGWKKLKDLPTPVVAAPGPAYTSKNKLYIFGGDDGKLAKVAADLKEKHPGFSDQILAFDVLKNEWSVAGKIHINIKADAGANPNASTWPAVTSTLVIWNGSLIFPSGEVRPAIRTPRVTVATPIKN